jgi:hypothetical protein
MVIEVRTRYRISSLSDGRISFHSSGFPQKIRYESSAYGPHPGRWETGVGCG